MFLQAFFFICARFATTLSILRCLGCQMDFDHYQFMFSENSIDQSRKRVAASDVEIFFAERSTNKEEYSSSNKRLYNSKPIRHL